MTNRFLLSSVGAKITLISALQKSKLIDEIWVADSDPNALAKHLSPRFLALPATSEATHSDLVADLVQNQIRFVLPTRDGELAYWARHREEFAALGISVLVSNVDTVQKSLDKFLFHELLAGKGIPSVPTFLDHKSMKGNSVVIKERFGSGSRNISLGVPLTSAEEIAGNFENPIFQPFLKGKEFSVDVWRSGDGKKILAVPRWRTLIASGESKVTTIFNNPEISKIAKETAEILGIEGICVVQGLLTDNGQIQIIECNARIGGASTASIYGGAPFIDLSILDFTCGVDDNFFDSISINLVTQVRHQIDQIF